MKQTIKNKPNKIYESISDWLPIMNIKKGVVYLNNGSFVKLIEIQPINFLLRSKIEQKRIILTFKEFLKACLFPMQISIQSLRADISNHTVKMKEFYNTEQNENTKELISAYIDLVENLQNTEGVKRRFYISFPFVPVPGVNNYTEEEINKQLDEKAANIKNFIKLCGNQVENPDNEEYHLLGILYACLNKRSYQSQKLTTNINAHLFPVSIGKTEDE